MRASFLTLGLPLPQKARLTRSAEEDNPEADDGDRTRDPQLGKLMLYQLSYVRAHPILAQPRRDLEIATNVA
jgi:hypothetical protein